MNVQIGDRVSFIGRDKVQMTGMVIRKNPTRAKVLLDNRIQWNVPYAMLGPEGRAPDLDQQIRQKAASVRIGQSVRFGKPNGRIYSGVVTKVNAKSIKIDGDDGRFYTVHPSLIK